MAEVLTRRMLEQMLFAIDRPMALVRSSDTRISVSWVNESFAQLTGHTRAQLLDCGNTWLEDEDDFAARLVAQAGAGEFQVAGRRASGELVSWTVRAMPVSGFDGETGYWMLQCSIDPAIGTPAQAACSPYLPGEQPQPVREDPVTGMLSRRWFEEMLQHQLGGARRRKQSLALLLFEVEHFDIFLQTFGRKTGDACLRLVARGIASAMRRSTDLVARVGNSRFAALAEDMDEAQVLAHGKRIREVVEGLCIHHPRSPAGRYVTVRCSYTLGIPKADTRLQDWLTPLDEANACKPVTPLQRTFPAAPARSSIGVTSAMTPNAGWSK
jgi:diguanylate cyclase (GGDEF)-like protein